MRRHVEEDAEMMERILHKYMQMEKRPISYGDGIQLSQREIHTIAAIGENPDINVTDLAHLQGITKGAVSQMVYKLVDKGYVSKTTSPTSDAQVQLTLTKPGQAAFKGHSDYHREQAGGIMGILREMPDETYAEMHRLLASFEEMIDETMKK